MVRIFINLNRSAFAERIIETAEAAIPAGKPRFLFPRDQRRPIALFSSMVLLTLLSVSVRGQGTITDIAKLVALSPTARMPSQ